MNMKNFSAILILLTYSFSSYAGKVPCGQMPFEGDPKYHALFDEIDYDTDNFQCQYNGIVSDAKIKKARCLNAKVLVFEAFDDVIYVKDIPDESLKLNSSNGKDVTEIKFHAIAHNIDFPMACSIVDTKAEKSNTEVEFVDGEFSVFVDKDENGKWLVRNFDPEAVLPLGYVVAEVIEGDSIDNGVLILEASFENLVTVRYRYVISGDQLVMTNLSKSESTSYTYKRKK